MTFVFLVGLGIISYQLSYALFASSASNVGNSFTAAGQFPITSPETFPSSPNALQTGDVVINEINWAGSFNSSDEWLELRNTTGNSIDLSGWNIDGLGSGASAIVIPSGKSISGNGFFLISNFDATNTSSNLNISPDVVNSSISLANTSELLTLKTATSGGNVIDVAGTSSGSWFAGSSSAPRKSMERNTIPGVGTISTNWHTASTSVNLDAGATESATPKAVND